MAGIVIIGAGHGGAQAAASLRQGGFEGPISLISDEAEIPYHKPPLSKSFLKAESEIPQPLFAEKFYADRNIELLLGTRVAAIEPANSRVALAAGGTLAYTHLILATGARGRTLAVPQAGLANIFGLRSAADAGALRAALPDARSIVIIGGGFIGLEAAATLAGRGHRVTVLEAAPRLLGRAVSPAVSAYVHARQTACGVRVITQAGIEMFLGGQGRVRGVLTTTGETLPADLALVGIGAVPNAELVKEAGLACANGVVVDAGLRTEVGNIFAIGDCAAYPHRRAGRSVRLESVQNAVDHARHVARTILGRTDDYDEVPWFWSEQGETRLQMAGIAFDADRHILSGVAEEGEFSVYHFRDDRLLAVDSVNRTLDHMLARKLIGAGLSPTEADIAAGPEQLKAMLAARR